MPTETNLNKYNVSPFKNTLKKWWHLPSVTRFKFFNTKLTGTRVMAEFGVFLALFIVMYAVSNTLSKPLWPQGGAITVTFAITIIIAFRLGSIMGSFIWFLGVLIGSAFTSGIYIVSFWSFILDYFAGPILILPLSKLVADFSKRLFLQIIIVFVLCCILDYFCKTLSGVFYYGQDPETGVQLHNWALWSFSLAYNAGYLFASYALSFIVLVMLFDHVGSYIDPSQKSWMNEKSTKNINNLKSKWYSRTSTYIIFSASIAVIGLALTLIAYFAPYNLSNNANFPTTIEKILHQILNYSDAKGNYIYFNISLFSTHFFDVVKNINGSIPSGLKNMYILFMFGFSLCMLSILMAVIIRAFTWFKKA